MKGFEKFLAHLYFIFIISLLFLKLLKILVYVVLIVGIIAYMLTIVVIYEFFKEKTYGNLKPNGFKKYIIVPTKMKENLPPKIVPEIKQIAITSDPLKNVLKNNCKNQQNLLKISLPSSRPSFTDFKTNETSIPSNEQNPNLENIEDLKIIDIQNNTLNRDLKINLEKYLDFINSSYSQKKTIDLKNINNDSNSKENEFHNIIETPSKKSSFMVQPQKSFKNEKNNVKWFEEKQKIFGTIQFYISNFLQDNFEKISNKQTITFDMWVEYVNKNPSINLDSQELSEVTFEKYRKLWFLSKFQTSYRKYYEIPYKIQKYSDLNGQYYEDFLNFLNNFLKKFELENPENVKKKIIYHYNNIIQKILYQDLPKRSRNPKYFASAMLFYNINSLINISQTNFTSKLNLGNDVKIDLSYLSILIKFLYKIYFNKQNISDYKPSIPDSIIDNNVYYNQLFEHVNEGIKILKLPFKTINQKCIDLYNQAIRNGFEINTFPIKHAKYIATTLLFLSILSNDEIESLNQSNIVDRLENFKLNPTRFSNTIHLFQNYLDEQIFVPFQKINDRELFEKQIKEIVDEDSEYLEGKLILTLFQLSNLDPVSFVKNLKIYNMKNEYLRPSFLLVFLKKKTEFVQRKKFNEIIKRFNIFIETYIPKDLKSKADDILNEYIRKRLLKKFDSLRRAEQKKRLTESLYGENYRSIEKRFNNFCDMRGFSPFDGADLIELLEEGETLVFHHMDYDPRNDDFLNLCFLPRRVIENQVYISHNIITGLQANLEHWNDRPDTARALKKKLDGLCKLGLKNSKIIRNAVRNKNIDELDKLENWSKKSIVLLINRIFKEDFESKVWKYKTKLSRYEYQYKDYKDFY